MRAIANSKGASKTVEAGGVVLTRQIVKSDDVSPPGPASSGNSDHGKGSSDSDTSTFDSRKTDSKYKPVSKWNNDRGNFSHLQLVSIAFSFSWVASFVYKYSWLGQIWRLWWLSRDARGEVQCNSPLWLQPRWRRRDPTEERYSKDIPSY